MRCSYLSAENQNINGLCVPYNGFSRSLDNAFQSTATATGPMTVISSRSLLVKTVHDSARSRRRLSNVQKVSPLKKNSITKSCPVLSFI